MKMYIDIPGGYVNLGNVVSVKFEQNRVIFNYNTEISLSGEISPDYTYVSMYDRKERNELIEKLLGHGFITFDKSDNAYTFTNLDNVTSIKEYVKEGHNFTKHRLIFNLNVGNTLKDTGTVTSNAIYYDFDTEADFLDATYLLAQHLNMGE